MRKSAAGAQGTVHRLEIESVLLQGNPMGDPSRRPLLVYAPPEHDGRPLPLLVDLIGYTGSGASHTNWRPFGLNLPERLDRLITSGAMPPVFVALPDCFTAFGGNQYIDSTATGPYMSHLIEEVVPFVERHFPILPGQAHRGVFGKSSGGYGAIVHATLRSDFWGACAMHSGDAGFEYLFIPEFPKFLSRLLQHDGDVVRLFEALHAKEKFGSDDVNAIMTIGMAAHFDPDPSAPLGLRLPFDTQTGRLDPDRWARWLAWDPVRLVEQHGRRLASLRALYIDCGTRDQYNLLWGARMLHEALERQGVSHRYEEFDDDHSDVDYRMDQSLPFLARALMPPS